MNEPTTRGGGQARSPRRIALAGALALLSVTASVHAKVAPHVHAEAKGGTWARKAPLPVALAESGVTAVNGRIYVIGGALERTGTPIEWSSTVTLMYDPATNIWRRMAPIPAKISHVGLATLNGKIYAVGGFTDIVHMNPQALAFVYDPASDAWTRLPDISSPRGSVAVAAIGGKIHVFGGRQANQVVPIPMPAGAPPLFQTWGTVAIHQIFDPATGKWSMGSPVPGPPRDHMGVAVVDGKVHLFGGRTADVVDNLDRHDVYDPRTDRWSMAAPLPRPRSAGAFAVVGKRIVYAGGECIGLPGDPAAKTFDDVTIYDSYRDRWSSLSSLPHGRHAFGAATVGGVIYFAGGAPVCGAGATNDMLALKPPAK